MYKLTKFVSKFILLLLVAVTFSGCRYTQEVCWNGSGWFMTALLDRVGKEVQIVDRVSKETYRLMLTQELTGEFKFVSVPGTAEPGLGAGLITNAIMKSCEIEGRPYVELKTDYLGQQSYVLFEVSEVVGSESGLASYDFTQVTFDEKKLQQSTIPFQASSMDMFITNDGFSPEYLLSTRSDEQGSAWYGLQ